MLRSLLLVALLATTGILVGTGVAKALTALIDGATVSGSPSQEEQAATAQGYAVTVVSGATWASMTQAQFGAYDLLIIGDPTCSNTSQAAAANAATWAPVVMGTAGGRTQAGNRVLIGTDPVYHDSGYLSSRATIIRDGIKFAGQPGKTGLYFDASCSGGGGNVLGALVMLSTGSGAWTNNDFPPCGGNVSLIASEPSFGAPDTLTTASLQGWGCSVHEAWPTFPTDWSALAVATDTSTTPTCGVDPNTGLSACGQAYVLIAGSSIVVVSGSIAVTPADATNPVGTSHTITAHVTSGGSPLVGQLVTFTVTGQNSGAVGVCSPIDCKSDVNGDVTFTYTDTNGAGDDTIKASFTDAGGSLQSATAQKHWVTPCGACDDHNPCTDDSCDPDTGICGHTNNTNPCNDGFFCTVGDTCGGGVCTGTARDCSAAADQCNDGVCNEAAGACEPQPKTDTTPCDDGFLCTVGDTCASGVCTGTTRDCSAAADQCNNGVCNEAAGGVCEPQPKADTTLCNDGDACTTGDHCSSGNCVGGAPRNCDDGNECTADSCDHATGCVNDRAARNGFACDDGNVCTQRDACSNGVCGGATTLADSDGDGYCDFQEIQAGCNQFDFFEVPPQPVAWVGQPGEGGNPLPNGLLTYAAPSARRRAKISVGTDPSCATLGVCGPRGFCTAGKIGDPCTANGNCNQPANTCRLVVNYANVSDLALTVAKLKRTPVPGFTPATRGCSRKVDVTLGSLSPHRGLRLLLRATGTLGGRLSHDRDRFSYTP